MIWKSLVSTTLPTPGLHGLLNPWVGIPPFLLAIVAAIVLSVSRFQKIETLFFCGGILSAVGFTLMLYISNSGGLALALSGSSLAMRGRELLSTLENHDG